MQFSGSFEIVNSEAISFNYRFCLNSAEIYNALNFIMQWVGHRDRDRMVYGFTCAISVYHH